MTIGTVRPVDGQLAATLGIDESNDEIDVLLANSHPEKIALAKDGPIAMILSTVDLSMKLEAGVREHGTGRGQVGRFPGTSGESRQDRDDE